MNDNSLTFYLGAHHPSWLSRVPHSLFVSRRRMCERKTFPRALAPWALDSGGFSELTIHGKWTLTARDYVSEVRRFSDGIGKMRWAAAQDWMCEPHILRKTGLTVAEHQRRTIDNALELMSIAPELPWAPVIQGWTHADCMRHTDDYARAGIDLASLPVVGVGSICRRQATSGAAAILKAVAARGIKAHGFGLKTDGIQAVARFVSSADSMAWSLAGRYTKMAGCEHRGNCANCMRWALHWRLAVLDKIKAGRNAPVQLSLL